MFLSLRTVIAGLVQTISLVVLNLLNLFSNFTHFSMWMTLDSVTSWKEGLLTVLNLLLMDSDILACMQKIYGVHTCFSYIWCLLIYFILIVLLLYFSRAYCYKLKRESKPVFVADLFVVTLAQLVGFCPNIYSSLVPNFTLCPQNLNI